MIIAVRESVCVCVRVRVRVRVCVCVCFFSVHAQAVSYSSVSRLSYFGMQNKCWQSYYEWKQQPTLAKVHFNWTLGNKDTPNCYHAFPSSFCQNFLHPKKAAQGTVCLNRLPSHHRNPHILVPFIIVSPVKHTLMDHSLLDRSRQVTRLKARLGCAKKKKKNGESRQRSANCVVF